MRAPMMMIHTVAAGGGSILHFDGARFRVGPDSAGANPGPKCYGARRAARGDRRQSDDRQADPAILPEIFGPGPRRGARRQDRRDGVEELAGQVGDGRSAEQVADGFIAIAVAKMTEAIKKISVARGHDVTRYVLNCFGGAGGQHACDVADALSIKTVLIHPLSSLLSAYGMGLADISASRGQGIEEPLREEALARVAALADQTRRAGDRRSGGPGRRARVDQSCMCARNCAMPARTPRSR